jgi:hypothetical protein
MTIQARRADRNGSTRVSVAPPGLTPFSKIDPGAARLALAPGFHMPRLRRSTSLAPTTRLRRCVRGVSSERRRREKVARHALGQSTGGAVIKAR